MQQLQSLRLESGSSTLRVSSSLAGLTAVSQLKLWGHNVIVDAAAQLPPNVERLSVTDMQSEALPQQVSLRLEFTSCQAWHFAAGQCTAIAVRWTYKSH